MHKCLSTSSFERRLQANGNRNARSLMAMPMAKIWSVLHSNMQHNCSMTCEHTETLKCPSNIMEYALLLSMIAQVTGKKPGTLVYTIGDAHIYKNHFEQVKEQLSRTPLPLPVLWLNKNITDIDSFTKEDIDIVGYRCHPAIKAPVAV